MSDAFYCLAGWAVTFAFVLAFLYVWKLTFPGGEPGIRERAQAAMELFREARNLSEKVWSICLGILILIKGVKGLLIGFFTFLLGSMSASICGYEPWKIVERILDFLEKLLFSTQQNTVPIQPNPS